MSRPRHDSSRRAVAFNLYPRLVAGIVAAALALSAAFLASPARGQTGANERYIVVFDAVQLADGSYALGGNYALNHDYALSLVEASGGSVLSDLSAQIGVVVVESPNALFAEVMRSYALVEEVGSDFGVKALPDVTQLTVLAPEDIPEGGPEQTADPLESLQWDMAMIHAPEAHDVQAGAPSVDVGILDSGIDAQHPDFILDGGGTNVDCARGHNSVSFLPTGPGLGNPDPCIDNQFHGTHVAGTVAAQANGIGVVGVAPNVTLVPVKVCDTSGYCYAAGVVDGITYAGDQQLDVINMSFFVDDDEFQESTEFKCQTDATQRAFRRAVERAIQYARGQGVTPVAALGNSDTDLAHPPAGNDCESVPQETSGVIGVAALGARSQKASYSNYGTGATDVAAPGGSGTTGDCRNTILSTLPGGTYGCIQGTSMASPHAAGVAALLVSQFGTLGSDGDVKLSPNAVQSHLQSTTVDIGLSGYDECFGNGRIDALRAVLHDTSSVYDATAPFCPEYNE
jgi:subtilisin family serine protease